MSSVRYDSARVSPRIAIGKPTVVLALGPLPPPYHGASIVNELMLQILHEKAVRVQGVDSSGAGRSGVRYLLARLAAHARAVSFLLNHRLFRRRVAVYITGAGGAGIWYQAVVVGVSRLLRFPVVYHHHSFAYLNVVASSMRWLVFLGGSRALHVALCEEMRRLLVRLYPGASRTIVCSNAAFIGASDGADSADSKDGDGLETVHLGHLSNLTTAKGLAVVLTAHRKARSAGYAVHLHLAGPIADREAELMLRDAMRLDEEKTLTYHGRLPRSEIGPFLKRLDVFLFPSRYRNEAEPLVVLEALSAGVPVLAFGIGCLGSALGATGWLVENDTLYVSRLIDILDQIGQLPGSVERRQFLHAAAVQQRAGFGPANVGSILGGLGL